VKEIRHNTAAGRHPVTPSHPPAILNKVKVKVKQSRYRSRGAQRFPGS